MEVVHDNLLGQALLQGLAMVGIRAEGVHQEEDALQSSAVEGVEDHATAPVAVVEVVGGLATVPRA